MFEVSRRQLLGAGAIAGCMSSRVLGANDRIAIASIGTGNQGGYNLGMALQQPGVEVVAVCDVFEPSMKKAVGTSKGRAKPVKDFREILQDKSIDAVCISTPDHWHAYMTVEACKAGKDVYVEKPVCTVLEEGRMMVEAARKCGRVVQVGTMQRSGEHFQKAVEVVRSGKIGQVTFCRTWNFGNLVQEGFGNPPDQKPPADLDWDMWLGPAPERPYNPARFLKGQWRHFRDYGGSLMTDWGVHLLDIVQMAFGDLPPTAVTALGSKYYLKDSRDYPDTFLAAYEYPEFAATYEYRFGNAQLPYDNRGYGILFHGTKGSLFVDRSLYRIIPEKNSTLQPEEVKSSNQMNKAHWANFLECIKTRKRPVCDIEIGYRTTATCLLGNVAWRSRQRVDWDSQNETTVQESARRFLTREYRAPWKLTV